MQKNARMLRSFEKNACLTLKIINKIKNDRSIIKFNFIFFFNCGHMPKYVVVDYADMILS